MEPCGTSQSSSCSRMLAAHRFLRDGALWHIASQARAACCCVRGGGVWHTTQAHAPTCQLPAWWTSLCLARAIS